MLDDALKRVAEREVPWSELRQAAVLRRLNDRTAVPGRRPKRRWPWALAVACAAVAVLLTLRSHLRRVGLRTAPAIAALPSAGEMLLRLPDGSVARGQTGADVKVESLRADYTELVQTSGNVLYDVVPDPHRRFVVRARDVAVSVLGTSFHVDMASAAVAVSVERGTVEVAQNDRRVVLEAGEAITFDTAGAAQANTSSGGHADDRGASAPPELETNAGQPRTAPSAPAPFSPAQLLERADRARARGDLEAAARALNELLQRYAGDSRVSLAQFMLGRVRSAQGAYHDAAQAFAACLAREPSGSLAEDALAELARAHARAGEGAEAVSAARRYTTTYPHGVHQRAMRELAGAAN